MARIPCLKAARQAGYGGCHTWFITVDSAQPDKAWLFMEHFGSRDVNIRWALHFDRLPIRSDVADSEEYHQGDDFVRFSANMMQHRKFVIPLPGAPSGAAVSLTASFRTLWPATAPSPKPSRKPTSRSRSFSTTSWQSTAKRNCSNSHSHN